MDKSKRRLYHVRKEQGVCVTCGVYAVENDFSSCKQCRERRRAKWSSMSEEKRKEKNLATAEYHRKIREKRKAADVCPYCKINTAAPGKVSCKECLAEQREEYRYLLKMGVCRYCRQRDVEPNRTLCFECAQAVKAREPEKRSNYTPEQKKTAYEQNQRGKKRQREHRKANGLCIYCGKRKSMQDVFSCIDCRAAINRNARKGGLPRVSRSAFGFCYICEAEVVVGKKLCQRCLANARSSIAKAKEAQIRNDQLKTHVWRLENELSFQKWASSQN